MCISSRQYPQFLSFLNNYIYSLAYKGSLLVPFLNVAVIYVHVPIIVLLILKLKDSINLKEKF